MAELVTFPDAVYVYRAGLIGGLPEVGYANVRVAEDRPPPELEVERFVLLDRTGGARSSIVTDVPQLTADSYADGRVAALELAGAVRAVTNALANTVVAGVVVHRVTELAGPGRLWDPILEVDFYRQTFTIVMRGGRPA